MNCPDYSPNGAQDAGGAGAAGGCRGADGARVRRSAGRAGSLPRGAGGRRRGENPFLKQASAPPEQSANLRTAQMLPQRGGQGFIALQTSHKPLQVCQQVFRDGLTGKIPHYRAQFFFHVKTQTLIDQPDVPLWIHENMPPFTVGVVGEQVKQHHRTQTLLFFGGEVEKVVFGIVLHEPLQRPRSQRRAAAVHGRRYKVPSQRLTDQIRRHFAVCQGALGEIPQRLFSAHRFVHSGVFLALPANRHQKGVVGASQKLPLHFNFPFG